MRLSSRILLLGPALVLSMPACGETVPGGDETTDQDDDGKTGDTGGTTGDGDEDLGAGGSPTGSGGFVDPGAGGAPEGSGGAWEPGVGGASEGSGGAWEPGVGGAPGGSGGSGLGGWGGADPEDSECKDGVLNNGEEEIDCGFEACSVPCLTTTSCANNGECASGYCHQEDFCANPLSGVHQGGLNLISAADPYVLTGDIQVGTLLQISAGTVLLGEGHEVRVAGDISATGTSGSPIVLSNVVFDVGNSASKPDEPVDVAFAHANIFGGAIWTSGQDGVYVDNFNFTHNRITGADYFYISYPASGATVSFNVFYKTGGLSIGVADSVATVENNHFEGVQNPYDSHAAIALWASIGTGALSAHKNTFVELGGYALAVEDSGTVFNAENNYFSTTDDSAIQALIYDENDDLDLSAAIAYWPFLTSVDPSTPSL